MKKAVLLMLITVYWLACATAQTVSNIRAKQDPELSYWKINFDLSGNADDQYQIKLIPFKTGKEISSTRSLGGQTSTNPGKNLVLFWNPFLEGLETDGWQFRISAEKTSMIFVQGDSF
ncbi:MAG: hypothetical protein Q8J62_00625, partial [Candidatus Cloacimonadaceae bacterium]|nr:hypothetical protein [Candidatus Cloacimonadaceae bacterium]